jgi:hypothetical protein
MRSTGAHDVAWQGVPVARMELLEVPHKLVGIQDDHQFRVVVAHVQHFAPLRKGDGCVGGFGQFSEATYDYRFKKFGANCKDHLSLNEMLHSSYALHDRCRVLELSFVYFEGLTFYDKSQLHYR